MSLDGSKVNQLFDLTDNSPKQALKQVAKYEVKHPNSQLLQAMKAVNLIKTGQHDAAREVAQKLATQPTPYEDENVVHLMCWALRELNMREEAVASLKRTHAAHGANPTVTEAYFTALLWDRNFSAMQQVAQQTHKQSRSMLHYTWTVICNLLQCDAAQDDSASLLLMLADKVLEKIVSADDAVLTRELVWLRVHVLRRRGDHDAALAYLETPRVVGVFPSADDRTALKLQVHRERGDTAAANATYKQLLSSDAQRDNWTWWAGYFETLEALIAAGGGGAAAAEAGAGPAADRTWEEADAMVAAAAAAEAKVEATRLRRATALAGLHLEWRKLNAGCGDAAALAEGIVRYVGNMRYKAQSHMDVAKFLPAVAAHGKAGALIDLLGRPADAVADVASFAHELLRHLFSYALGLFDDADDAALYARVAELLSLADASAPLSAALEWSEAPHGDRAVHLAALLLFDRFSASGDRQHLAEALAVLQRLPRPKNNTELQLWQLLLPPMVGVSRQVAVAAELDVKYIQLESLLYMHHNAVLTLNSEEEAAAFFSRVKAFHRRWEHDQAEIALVAWKKLTCSKIFEMESFRTTLAASAGRREAAVEFITTKYLASCGLTANDKATLDLVDTVADMDVDFTVNQDTKCVGATLLCAPDTERAERLKKKLLETTFAMKEPAVRKPAIVAKYRTLRALRALCAVMLAKAQAPALAAKQKADQKAKKKKKGAAAAAAPAEAAAAAPAAEAVIPWEALVAEAKAAAEAWNAFEHAAVDEVVPAELFAPSKEVSVALFALVAAAAGGEREGDLGAEAGRLGAALDALAEALLAATAGWAANELRDARGVRFALRYALSFATVAVDGLLGCAGLKQRGGGAALHAPLGRVVDALGAVGDRAKGLTQHVKQLEGNGALLAALCGLDAGREFLAGKEAAAKFDGFAAHSWTTVLKSVANEASSRAFEARASARRLAA